MKEEQLEMLYLYCLEDNCILAKEKTNSLKSYVRKGLATTPHTFTSLENSTQELISYLESKTTSVVFSEDDVMVYLA